MADTLHKRRANYGFYELNSFDSIDYYRTKYTYLHLRTWQCLSLSFVRTHGLVMVSELMAGFRQAS